MRVNAVVVRGGFRVVYVDEHLMPALIRKQISCRGLRFVKCVDTRVNALAGGSRIDDFAVGSRCSGANLGPVLIDIESCAFQRVSTFVPLDEHDRMQLFIAENEGSGMMDAVLAQGQLLRLIGKLIACWRNLLAHRIHAGRKIERLSRVAPLHFELTVFVGGIVVSRLPTVGPRTVERKRSRADAHARFRIDFLDNRLARAAGRDGPVRDSGTIVHKRRILRRIRMRIHDDGKYVRGTGIAIRRRRFLNVEGTLGIASPLDFQRETACIVRRAALITVSRRLAGGVLEHLKRRSGQHLVLGIALDEFDVALKRFIHRLGLCEEHGLLIVAVLRRIDVEVPRALDSPVIGVIP